MLEIGDDGDVRIIRLSRAPVNALNGELVRKLTAAVEDASGKGAIVIAGQPGLFSAGLDVPGMLALDHAGIAAAFVDLWRVLRAIATSPVPVVFAITGHCPAGGTVLAINGDYRVMAQGEYRLGLNEVQVGLFPGEPIHSVFKRLVGGHAAQLLTRGALIDPATAFRMGLVDELCEASEVFTRALAVARELGASPRGPMSRTRVMVRRDLTDLYGSDAEVASRERAFGVMGAEMWFAPGTQELLKRQFVKQR